jgi:hypothetical protein
MMATMRGTSLPVTWFLTESGTWPHARQLVHQAMDAAHVLHLLELVLQVVEVEPLALGNLLRELLRLVLSTCCSTCSTSDSTSPMSRMRLAMRSGWNTSRPIGLLTHADELDRLVGDVADRQRGATARIAIGLGQHHAGERQRFAKCLAVTAASWPVIESTTNSGLDRVHRAMQAP